MSTYIQTTVKLIATNIVSRSFYLLNILLINNNFATDSNTDLLFFLLVLTTNITFYVNFISQDAILPELIRIQHIDNSIIAVQFFTRLFKLYLLIITSLVIFYSLFGDQFLLLVTDFDPIIIERNKKIILLFSPIIFCSVSSYFLGGLLSAAKKFNIVLYVGLAANLSSILFYWLDSEKRMNSIVLGMTVGYGVGFVGLLYYTFNKTGISLKFSSKKVPEFSESFIKEVSSNAILSFLNILGYTAPYVALTKFSDGSLSMFNFCTQVSNIPVSMVIAQIASVAAVKFSTVNNTGNKLSLENTYYKIQYKLILGMIVLGILSNILFPHILPLIIKGKDVKYYETCVKFFSIISLSLPAIGHNVIYSKLLVAKQFIFKYKWIPTTYNVTFIFLTIISSYFNSYILVYVVSIAPIIYSLFLEYNVAWKVFANQNNKYFILLLSYYFAYFAIVFFIYYLSI